MARLRAVAPDETAPPKEPKNLVESLAGSRREFLAMARKTIAREIDGGTVPAHALGRLIAELAKIDAEIRTVDAAAKNEADEKVPEDGKFDPAAV